MVKQAIKEMQEYHRRKLDVIVLNLKMRALILVTIGVLAMVCIVAPLWLYAMLVSALSIEFVWLSDIHSAQSKELSLQSREISAEKRLLTISAMGNMLLTAVSLGSMYIFEHFSNKTLGYTPDYHNWLDPIVIMYTIFKSFVIYSLADRLHHFYHMRMFWKIEYKEPPITKLYNVVLSKYIWR